MFYPGSAGIFLRFFFPAEFVTEIQGKIQGLFVETNYSWYSRL
jgi:hypothetical protein